MNTDFSCLRRERSERRGMRYFVSLCGWAYGYCLKEDYSESCSYDGNGDCRYFSLKHPCGFIVEGQLRLFSKLPSVVKKEYEGK